MWRKTRKAKLIQIALLKEENGRRGRWERMCARRERTLVKKRRNIKYCENKKEKRYAGYVINSDKFHRTQQEEN